MDVKKWNFGAPAFLYWSFGDQPYSHPIQSQSAEFKVRYQPWLKEKTASFRASFDRAIERVDAARTGRKVALAFSGGLKSELLAHGLSEAGIPFELYFFDFWGLNTNARESAARPLARSFGKELHVLRAERVPFYKHAKKLFLAYGCESPTPLLMAYLFERIPSEQFLLAGDGGLDRIGALYSHIGERFPKPSSDAGIWLPFSTSNLFFYWWATERKRAGEFYFYHSTPELVGAALSDSNLEWSYPFCDTRKILSAAFPQIPQRKRFTNWDGHDAEIDNLEIRKALWRLAMQSDGFSYWQRFISTNARASELFL